MGASVISHYVRSHCSVVLPVDLHDDGASSDSTTFMVVRGECAIKGVALCY